MGWFIFRLNLLAVSTGPDLVVVTNFSAQKTLMWLLCIKLWGAGVKGRTETVLS